jgi:uncharacterized membrane protein HdeD (DUF308 family)
VWHYWPWVAARYFTDENACVSFFGVEKRPRSIIFISLLFILLGTITLIHAVVELINTTERLTDLKSHWMIYLSAAAAIVGGVFLFKGHNWARWLLVAWMAFHIVVGALHGLVPLLTHVVIFSVILFFLFRRPASSFFSADADEALD